MGPYEGTRSQTWQEDRLLAAGLRVYRNGLSPLEEQSGTVGQDRLAG